MERRFTDYLIISLKGVAMGIADAIPGVSGGTIAFISGIYEELINSISGVNFSLFKTLKNNGLKAFWIQANGSFLLALLIGMLVSFVSFLRLAKYLIEQHPVLIWSFFFGLILVSIYFVGKQITQWNYKTVLTVIIGALLGFYITSLPALSANESLYFLFFAGALAICAMILPGISGSFILIVLGAYKTLSNAFNDWDLKKIFVFGIGTVVGLLSFSRILKWLFKNYHNSTLAVLTGFIAGSLNKIWPWKKTISVLNNETGTITNFSELSNLATLSIFQKQINNFESYRTVVEQSISPFKYSELNNNIVNNQFFPAVGLMLVGIFTILILEKIGSKKTS